MHVTLLSTGGTIASTDTSDGAQPSRTGSELVERSLNSNCTPT
jgi:L-asparaginase